MGGREFGGSGDFVGSGQARGFDSRGTQACGLNKTWPELVAKSFGALAGLVVALTSGELKLAARWWPEQNSAQIGSREFGGFGRFGVALTPGGLKLAGRLRPKQNSAQIWRQRVLWL